MSENIAIFRALQLGDMLCAVPALRALRRAKPDARIVLIGLPWARSFVERYAHLVDELIVFPGAVGFPEQAETDDHLEGFWEAMRKRRFDLAIQMHGSGGIANEIVQKMGALANAGFAQAGEAPRNGIFVSWPDTLPEILRYTALINAMGIETQDTSLEIPLSSSDRAECETLMDTYALRSDRLILVHPGAQLPSRRWPADRFARVASLLADNGWQIAMTGTVGERMFTAGIALATNARAVDLAGKTSLGGLAALVSKARLVVCNDTGMSHVAVAMKTRSVVIALGSDTKRWAPLDHERHRVLAHYPPCRPCGFRDCPYGHPCALNISVEHVVDTAFEQLMRVSEVSGNAYGPVSHVE
ncbi:LPS biosynthesis related glycosyltransferase [Caballeronia udeis]|uniref:LPS biosynthesis related glycosyltransferase n=1 Tax=Caballeronia udeis TaxID=1232866 RepID=A0A158H289_9BURK|nr:glycosyltransferase family 9 protein [Caballeronia udeis]SAL38313.1 LPS biosynthesis related glycosyltransferase [Caballeronia udeis]